MSSIETDFSENRGKSLHHRLEEVEVISHRNSHSITSIARDVKSLLIDHDERQGIRRDGSLQPTVQDRMAEHFEGMEQMKFSFERVQRECIALERVNTALEKEIAALKQDAAEQKATLKELVQWKEAVYVPPVIKFTRCVPAPTVPQAAVPTLVIASQPEPAPVTTLPRNTVSPRWAGSTVSRNTCIPARLFDKLR